MSLPIVIAIGAAVGAFVGISIRFFIHILRK